MSNTRYYTKDEIVNFKASVGIALKGEYSIVAVGYRTEGNPAQSPSSSDGGDFFCHLLAVSGL